MKNRLDFLKTVSLKGAWNSNYKKCSILAACFFLSSCDSFVEVDVPSSQLTGEAVFEDIGTANAAMAGLYAKMRNNGILTGNATGISCYLGLYADEFDYYQQNAVSNFYNNTLFAAEPGVSDIWNQSYNQIYAANAIIEGLSNSTVLPEAGKNQLRGEALFVRALLHFYLLNLYGDIPYINTTDYVQNSTVSRMPTNTVYGFVVNDLNEAISLLPENYVSAERTVPNQSTAYALLARVYLYMGSYPEAANTASTVINNPLYTWETDLDKIFLKESTTTIWQFMPEANGTNTAEGDLYIFAAGPPAIVGLKPSFVDAFETNDQRKLHWTTAVTDGTTTWYYASKYKQESSTGSSVEYSIVFRLAEQYLIRAEARARQDDLIGAKEDVNAIRTTAGLPNTIATTATEIIADILNQRRFELFTEFGQRFFDLKRTAKLDQTLSGSKPGWNTTDGFWPLPALELSANPNLNPQNPGY
ncbi:RagB/SusD family nutrient uptake outer membrane protein [Flavobacterium ranwuense]|uniref:RagB/SusD family nutrient uptake outer membrane protein n=1 Tax=Flavobacterium ranwuense TaxID=2541725 RepID=A0ABY2DRL3_9FLAO|nr:RagB/SusD family nutrient uptake outer membrane protein [Flavobacterium ranwuense]TDE29401.1 RagB/SusD family nutrient uptake outer membrane protein [Flavobacterium ranwuense]